MDWNAFFVYLPLLLVFSVLPVVYSLLLITSRVPPADKRLSPSANRAVAWHLLILGVLSGMFFLGGAVYSATQPVLPIPYLTAMRFTLIGIGLGVGVHAIYRIRRDLRARDGY
jgi:hypothetical protein